MLVQYDPEMVVCECLDTVSKAVKWLQKSKPDLIFCDIHLGDGIAFSIFEQVSVNVPIIFTTAYDEYAIRAFQYNSIDYLLKPFDFNDLSKALNKFNNYSLRSHANINQLLSELSLNLQKRKKRFLVVIGDKIRQISCEEISHFFVQGKYLFLVTNEGTQYLIPGNLEKLQEELDFAKFFRVNRKYIIHADSIKEMILFSKNKIKIVLNLPVEEDIFVSFARVSDFRSWLTR